MYIGQASGEPAHHGLGDTTPKGDTTLKGGRVECLTTQSLLLTS